MDNCPHYHLDETELEQSRHEDRMGLPERSNPFQCLLARHLGVTTAAGSCRIPKLSRPARCIDYQIARAEAAEKWVAELEGAVGKAIALNKAAVSLAREAHNAEDEYLKGQLALARKTLYALGGQMTERPRKPISQATIIGQAPPTTWQELARDCKSAFSGGYHAELSRRIFHHGIQTAFNLLEGEMPPLPLCQRADAAEKERLGAIEFAAVLVRAIANHVGEQLTRDALAERVAANIAVHAGLADITAALGMVLGYVIDPCAAEKRVARGLGVLSLPLPPIASEAEIRLLQRDRIRMGIALLQGDEDAEATWEAAAKEGQG